MKNYYEILEVSENASYEIIEKAYRILAKKYHPDVWSNTKSYWAENKFKEITEAYQILSNPTLRKQYDMEIGLNISVNDKYNNLYSEQKRLEQEINNIKTQNYSAKLKGESNSSNSIFLYLKDFVSSLKTLLRNEKNKSPEERSKDFKAIVLTIIIISILLFIFWKVPFLRKFLFP